MKKQSLFDKNDAVIPQSRVNRLRNVSCELAYAELFHEPKANNLLDL